MRKKVYYYCDMDGVLADFLAEPQAVARFENEKGFFANLKPIKANIEIIRVLVENGASVRILSASPNEQADHDKKIWLKNHMPFIKVRNIILMRNGQNKADYTKTKGCNLLFDDYGKNCEQWEERPNHKAIKVKGIIEL